MDDMDDLLAWHPLDEVCAIQWQRCVEQARQAFEAMDSNRWLEVGYEDFVTRPRDELGRIVDFLDVPASPDELDVATQGVRSGSIGKGRAALDDKATSRLESLVGETLKRYGYA